MADAVVEIRWYVPERDGRGEVVVSDRVMVNYDPGFDGFARIVYRGFQSMMKHELDEAFHKDGVRVYDPHA